MDSLTDCNINVFDENIKNVFGNLNNKTLTNISLINTLTLRERLNISAQDDSYYSDGIAIDKNISVTLKQSPFNDPFLLKKWYSYYNLNEGQLSFTLNNQWLLNKKEYHQLALKFARASYQESNLLIDIKFDDLAFLQPEINFAVSQLTEKLRIALQGQIKNAFKIDTLIHAFISPLFNKLSLICQQAINYLREKNSLLPCNEEVYRSKLFNLFPALFLQITKTLEYWVTYIAEFAEHLCKDSDDIERIFFNGDSLGTLIFIKGQLGDSHNFGRYAFVCQFDCGKKLAYKPRSLALDAQFYQFLAFLTTESEMPDLYQPLFLCREQYGWMEYIDAQPCENESQLADYFYRSGCLLSILYILEAEDIHFENLIAMKNNPVVIDLETLFHLRDDNILSASTNSLEHSVLKTHLIPQYDSAIPKNEPAALLSVSCKNLTLSRNSLPTLYGRSIPINDYNNEFINGFEIGYKALLSLKKQLPTHLNYFVGLSARYIARSTKIYSQLWKLSCQAYHQQSAVKLELFYDKLWLDVKKRPFLDKLIDAEKEALLQGDIPFFTHVIGSKAVQLDSNTERQHYFQQDAYSLVLAKVNKMSIQDCNAQVKIIQHSLNLATKEKPSLVKLQLSFSANTSANNWFECSRIIANKIVTQAIVGSEKIFWPTFITDNNGVSCLDSTNYRLYDGTLGIILSLAYIADSNPQAIDSALIKCSAEELLNSLTNEHFTEEGCGAFEGLGGVIYVISHLYHLWQEPWLLTSAKIYLNKLAEIVTMDRAFDIQKGSAGAILSLLSLHKVANNLQALQIAKAFGDHLVAFVKKQDEYYGWVNSKGTILSGFAHGSAGIAYSLMKLYQMTSIDKYKAVAMQAITHEHACYCPKIGNWLDFRYDTLSEQKKAMSAWCNGAMGIGYSRMLMLGISNDSAFENMLLQDIDRAITNTLANPQLKEHGICHGHFGNQEFIYAWINSTQHSPDESQSDIAKRLPKAINEYLNDLNKNGLSPNSTYTESLGLMNGLAGISYQLLKFSLPNRLPSIMMLQPPVA